MSKSYKRIFHKDKEETFLAPQRVVSELGYKVDSLDKEMGLLNFKTGMSWRTWAGQEISAMLIDNGNGSVEVCISGRRLGFQIVEWGENKAIAEKIFSRMKEYLRKKRIHQ